MFDLFSRVSTNLCIKSMHSRICQIELYSHPSLRQNNYIHAIREQINLSHENLCSLLIRMLCSTCPKANLRAHHWLASCGHRSTLIASSLDNRTCRPSIMVLWLQGNMSNCCKAVGIRPCTSRHFDPSPAHLAESSHTVQSASQCEN